VYALHASENIFDGLEIKLCGPCFTVGNFDWFIARTVVHHAVSLLVSAAFTDGTVRSSLLQQSNFKPWLQQLVLLAKEVNACFYSSFLACLITNSCT